MTMTLPRIAGLKRAAELMLLGDRFDARRALELGLVNRLVPPAAIEAEAMVLATRLANGPTNAYGRTKALLEASMGQTLISGHCLAHGLLEHRNGCGSDQSKREKQGSGQRCAQRLLA